VFYQSVAAPQFCHPKQKQMYTQQNFTQLKQAASSFLLSAELKQFYKRVFCMGNILSFFVYVSIRLMLHDFPFEILEETFFIVRILLAGWCLAALCIGSFTLMMFMADNYSAIGRTGIQKTITLYGFCIKTIKAISRERLITRKRPVVESFNI